MYSIFLLLLSSQLYGQHRSPFFFFFFWILFILYQSHFLPAINAGFYFIPGALSVEDQCHWVKESLTEFPQPPNRTNHTAIYGPISDLFLASQNKKVLVEEKNLVADAEPEQSSFPGNGLRWVFRDNSDVPKGCKSVAASVLLRKLRWSTLGLQFNWTKVVSPHHSFLFLHAFASFIVLAKTN